MSEYEVHCYECGVVLYGEHIITPDQRHLCSEKCEKVMRFNDEMEEMCSD